MFLLCILPICACSTEQAPQQRLDLLRPPVGLLPQTDEQLLQADISCPVSGALVVEAVAGLLVIAGAQGLGQVLPALALDSDRGGVLRAGDEELGRAQVPGGAAFLRGDPPQEFGGIRVFTLQDKD